MSAASMGEPERRPDDDPARRAGIRRTAWILASIAAVFFVGVFASRLLGDASLGMTVIGAAVFLFLLLGIGRHLGGK
ncbi:MAG: hypothetical protein IT519_13490 [Burkholderiales bacterium]|nr:hypothetical protein [Burkholderiales bacterium]